MKKKTSKIVPIVMLSMGLTLIVASAILLLRDAAPLPELSAVPVQVNYAAPELELTTTNGTAASLAEYRGQVVLVNLWATWCPPCKEEMPALEAFYRKYREQGFVIVAINDGDPEPDVIQFVKDYGLTFPVWLDPTYIATEQAFKTMNLPSSFVIDRRGTIVLRWVGGINSRALEQYVTPIIKEQQ